MKVVCRLTHCYIFGYSCCCYQKSLSYLVPNMKQILKDFRLKETLATSEKIKPILNGLLFGRYISCQAERADYTLDLPNNDSTRYLTA